MKKIAAFCPALALLFALSAPILAEDKPKPTPEETFKKLDKDSDGKVSLAEYKGKKEGEKAEKAEARFKKLDKDNDGSLTLEEFKAGATKKK